jgi:diaminopimelate decarboxylase
MTRRWCAAIHLICYAVKANSSLAVINVLAQLGSGFDIVSGGELERVLRAGGDPRKTVFSGVGKNAAEMRAALAAGILCFNVESESELKRLDQVAGELGKPAPVSLRVNPDLDPGTHPHISTGLKESKFGVAFDDALPLYRSAAAMANLRIIGIDCHIGAQITDVSPVVAALQKLLHCSSIVWRQSTSTSRISISEEDSAYAIVMRCRPPSPSSVRH